MINRKSENKPEKKDIIYQGMKLRITADLLLETMTFSDIWKLKCFLPSRSTLLEIFQIEGKWYQMGNWIYDMER